MVVRVVMRMRVVVHARSVCEPGGMWLATIHTYPVKGCRRTDHRDASVEPWGLGGDRRWLVVEPDGKFLTQRAEPRLALIAPSVPAAWAPSVWSALCTMRVTGAGTRTRRPF